MTVLPICRNKCEGEQTNVGLCGLILYRMVPVMLCFSMFTACVNFDSQSRTDLESGLESDLRIDIERQNTEILQLKDEVASLQEVIKQKAVEINWQHAQQQEQDKKQRDASSEVSRVQVKLYRLATKPSAASAVTEAEVAMEDLKQNDSSASAVKLQEQAQSLLDTSMVAYENENYSGAMRYASQAHEFISMVADENRNQSYHNRKIVLIHSAITLWAETVINLREEPNSSSEVLDVLEKDSSFIVNAYRGNWLRVEIDGGAQGWVFNEFIRTTEHP